MQIDGSLAPREDASLTGQNLWNRPNWVFRCESRLSVLDGWQTGNYQETGFGELGRIEELEK
jgi:hypothetical protein